MPAPFPRLAVDGGTPIRNEPLPPWPHFGADEVEAVVSVLRSGRVNYWTGREGVAFEDEFASYVQRRHAIALANGTLALELALRVYGIGAGDDVIVPARTFIATASAAVAVGARPVVADVDALSGVLTPDSIEQALTPSTRAVIPVHLGGWPCDMDPIMSLAEHHDLVVIEDCAQALGACYKGRPVGSLGHAAAFSFCQDKIMTTGGEGGALALDDSALWEAAWSYKDHGKSYSATRGSAPSSGVAFKWTHDSFGTNWRMSEMQAAVGRLALPKVDGWVQTRRSHAAVLDEAVRSAAGLLVLEPGSDLYHAYYKYYAVVEPQHLREGWDRDRIAEAIIAEGIPCFSGSCPEIYLEKAFTDRGWGPAERLANARMLGERSLMFLVHPTLGAQDAADAAAAIEKVMAQAGVS